MNLFASLSSTSGVVRGRLQTALFHSRKRTREARKKNLGPELISNGDFTTGTNFSVTGESTLNTPDDASVISSAGALSSVNRALSSLEVNGLYQLQFEVVTQTTGAIQIDGVLGSGNVDVPLGAGTKKLQLRANASSGNVSVTRDPSVNGGICDVVIDNFSLKKVG